MKSNSNELNQLHDIALIKLIILSLKRRADYYTFHLIPTCVAVNVMMREKKKYI